MIMSARELSVCLSGLHQEAFGERPVAQQQMCVPESVQGGCASRLQYNRPACCGEANFVELNLVV